MWGEFYDEDTQTSGEHPNPSLESSGELDYTSEDAESAAPLLSLRDRLIHFMAASTIILKSQQRYEPDLTYQERKDIAEKLLDEKPGQFLYRFGRQLEREHLQYFLKYEGDAEVDYYLSEALKHKNEHTNKIIIRNRRYSALQKLRSTGDYFSEKEMERRNPLLYDQLIGKHQTKEEREDRYKIDSSNVRFSSILLDHIDKCTDNTIKKLQEDQEDEMFEEEEDTDNEEVNSPVESRKKQLFKEEFYSVGYHNFLRGKDEDFDYGQVDTSDDYDPLDIRARDEEERYFDEDEETHSDTGMCCTSSSMKNSDVQNTEQETSSKILENGEAFKNDEVDTCRTFEVDYETMEPESIDQCLMDIADIHLTSKT
ncbi:hypothetical protein OTU49_004266 [Cherax quadricarinatus]|uniref:CCD97-like C-terminal domain-containing protein n=1 Tax=Cherax quadricarinatus TaxID=27406 RepID=A0AAW0XD12_CHEQU|nr:coiled-coil domain-containing protein 97-like [Cherax quadricarinatus]XP_053642594.1 coiled-coil domain-containing protein 97-like [Cherax quadricarinatus]XP_053642595.1 coiled-coil domain-containing protein 97-like [Cherax quadricarinatus]XP_053642596.1 coiled-coil domain-containing protein 97-like [Cherax quadricarinatus]XP_053642598.1 coiled-coil domain-containing protein 97-like [Cherax quadricarinatus]XP_053642599.1 coiled-coil domain-containing protein 97-like [Cherax quadricarinatus]